MNLYIKSVFALLSIYLIFILVICGGLFTRKKYYINKIDNTNNISIETDQFTGVIFSYHDLAVREGRPSNIFTPTPEEVLVAEKILQKCYLSGNSALIGPRTTTMMLYPLEQYHRQYFGAVWGNGHRIIWVNSFRKNLHREEWLWKRISIVDGGANYFNICVNISAGYCQYFFINSEGG